MGSYINIGLVCGNNKALFIRKCLRFVNELDCFRFFWVKFPLDKKFKSWKEENSPYFSVKAAVEECYKNEMAEIACEFKIYEYLLADVILRVKHFEDGNHCLMIEIPEKNDIFSDVDTAEENILVFLCNIIGFQFAFCDSEADITDRIEELNLQEEYSIFVRYFDDIQVSYAKWKIDGITERI